jgi:hypothetical protein
MNQELITQATEEVYENVWRSSQLAEIFQLPIEQRFRELAKLSPTLRAYPYKWLMDGIELEMALLDNEIPPFVF